VREWGGFTSAQRFFGSGKISYDALALAKTLKISQVPAGFNKDALQTRYNTWLESTQIKKHVLPQSWYEGFIFSETATQTAKAAAQVTRSFWAGKRLPA